MRTVRLVLGLPVRFAVGVAAVVAICSVGFAAGFAMLADAVEGE